MIDYQKGREIAADVGETIKDHSIPLALIGAGLGWFIISSLQDNASKASKGTTGRYPAASDGPKSSSGLSDKVGAYTSKAQEAAQGALESVKSVADQTWSTVKDQSRDWSEAAGSHADRAYGYANRTFGDMVSDQPLLLGAAGLMIGAALGAVLPSTSYENEMVGETRDDLARTVKDFGREQYDKAQRVVERTIETAKEEAGRQGFSADSAREVVDVLKERATNVAQAVAETAKTEAGFAKPEDAGKDNAAKPGAGNTPGQAKPGSEPQRGAEPQRGNDMTSGTPGVGATPKRGNDMTS